MITPIFTIGTLWFWLIMCAWFAIMIVAMEKEGEGLWLATITMFVLVGILIGFGARAPISFVYHYVVDNPGYSVLWLVGYIVGGVVWSFIRWTMYAHFVKDKDKWRPTRYEKDTDEQYYERVKDYLRGKLDIKSNAKRVIAWMTYWPISLLWNALNNPVKRLFNYIFNRISGAYKKIADSIIERAVNRDMKKEQENKSKK